MSRNVALMVIFSGALLFAYDENSMPGLNVPTLLDKNCLEASVSHGFLREPTGTFPDNFISHANVLTALKYVILPKLEVGTSYQFFYKEYTFHAAYSLFFQKQYMRTQAMIQFFGASHDDNPTLWDENFLYQLNFQSDPIAGRVLVSADIAYNGLTKKMGIGTGVDVMILKNFDFLAEYYPVVGTPDTSYAGIPKVNYFSTGVKVTTAGHQFMFTISNDFGLGLRRHMEGAVDNTLYYGFSIQRLFAF